MLTTKELLNLYENKEKTSKEVVEYIKNLTDDYSVAYYLDFYITPLYYYVKDSIDTQLELRLINLIHAELENVDLNLLDYDDNGYDYIISTVNGYCDIVLELFETKF